MRYLVQFPAGTGDLILDAISPYAGNFKVHYRDDSAMIFDSPSAEGKVASIPFAKNSFVVIVSTPRGRIDKGVGRLGQFASVKFPPGSLRNSRFRTMIQIDGRPGETGLLRLPGAGTLPGLGTGARRLIRDLGRAHGARASRPSDRIRIAVLAQRDPLTVGAAPARPMETLARCART